MPSWAKDGGAEAPGYLQACRVGIQGPEPPAQMNFVAVLLRLKLPHALKTTT